MLRKAGTRPSAWLVGVLAIGVATSVGCFGHPADKVSEMTCLTGIQCPSGYTCAVPGVKGGCRRVGDGPDSGLAGGGGSNAGGAGGSEAGGLPDSPLPQPGSGGAPGSQGGVDAANADAAGTGGGIETGGSAGMSAVGTGGVLVTGGTGGTAGTGGVLATGGATGTGETGGTMATGGTAAATGAGAGGAGTGGTGMSGTGGTGSGGNAGTAGGPNCGNGIKEAPEQCDLGGAKNTGAYGGCNPNCTLAPYCGDGVVTSPEACDKGTSGNTGAYGGCNDNCTLGPYCGDGKINGPEVCDNGSSNALQLNACNPECSGLIGVKSLRVAPLTAPTFGGVAGADDICHSTFGPDYKAVVANGTTRVASTSGLTGQGQTDWALKKFTLYRNGNNQDVFVTDGTGLLGVRNQARIPLANSIYGYSAEEAYHLAAWSATDESWNYTPDNNCSSFTTTDGARYSGWISLADTDAVHFPNGGGVMPCDYQGHIICAEQ